MLNQLSFAYKQYPPPPTITSSASASSSPQSLNHRGCHLAAHHIRGKQVRQRTLLVIMPAGDCWRIMTSHSDPVFLWYLLFMSPTSGLRTRMDKLVPFRMGKRDERCDAKVDAFAATTTSNYLAWRKRALKRLPVSSPTTSFSLPHLLLSVRLPFPTATPRKK